MALTRARVVSSPQAFAAPRRRRDPQGALPQAQRAHHRRRRRRDARRHRQGKRRRQSLGPQIRQPAASSTSSSSRNICSSCTPRRCRKFSTLRRRACSTRPRGSACWRPKTPRCCGRRCGCFTISRRCCDCACPARSTRKSAGAGVLALLARAADLPDFPALQAHVTETQRQVRECFVRILGKAP